MRVLASLALACSILMTPWLARPGAAQQQAMLIGINECAQSLSLLVSVVSEGGKRETQGWFNLKPGAKETLIVGGNPLTHNVALPFYIYATNADESLTWGDKDLTIQWQGKSYGMQQRDLMMVDGTGPFPFRAVSFAC
jgi:hypothetical protein